MTTLYKIGGQYFSPIPPISAQCVQLYIGQYLFLATEQGEINTTHPNYDIIQHILIPACSVARKTPFMQFFNIFPSFTL